MKVQPSKRSGMGAHTTSAATPAEANSSLFPTVKQGPVVGDIQTRWHATAHRLPLARRCWCSHAAMAARMQEGKLDHAMLTTMNEQMDDMGKSMKRMQHPH